MEFPPGAFVQFTFSTSGIIHFFSKNSFLGAQTPAAGPSSSWPLSMFQQCNMVRNRTVLVDWTEVQRNSRILRYFIRHCVLRKIGFGARSKRSRFCDAAQVWCVYGVQ